MESMPIHPFDLQARAAAAAASLPALRDPERDGLMYFLGEWRARPPVAHHGLWDCGDGSGRHVDALTLLRAMLPPGAATDAYEGEAEIERWMLRFLAEDGLSWLPAEAWVEPWGLDVLQAAAAGDERLAEISWAQRGTLLGLTSRYLGSGDERYLEQAQRMVDGLLRVAVDDGHGLFFPEGYLRQGGWRYDRPGLHPGIEEYNAAVVVPALRLYESSGYEPALALADGLVAGALYHTPCYRQDGGLRPTVGELENHFHTHSNFALGVLKLGVVRGRREYVAWARQTYEHLKGWGTDFGWFPEGVGQRHGELCCTTDMLELALLLGRDVGRSYFADAERFGRNHLLESQFLSLDRLRQALDRLPLRDAPSPGARRFATEEGVAESQVGGFASRGALNDAFHLDATALMQCCNAAGARGLYDLWRYAVEAVEGAGERQPEYAIHLRFSVRTPALTVVSHEPAEGRLDVTVEQACGILVRLPEGAREAVAVVRGPDGGEPRVVVLAAREGYVEVDVGRGGTAEVRYPLPERVAHYEVGAPGKRAVGMGYWRGETLMRVDPPGPYYPLYDRSPEVGPVEPALPAGEAIASL